MMEMAGVDIKLVHYYAIYKYTCLEWNLGPKRLSLLEFETWQLRPPRLVNVQLYLHSNRLTKNAGLLMNFFKQCFELIIFRSDGLNSFSWWRIE